MAFVSLEAAVQPLEDDVEPGVEPAMLGRSTSA